VEEHLQQEPVVRKRLDLLWEYYVKHEMFLRAAVVLCRLAETPECVPPLSSPRLELTYAADSLQLTLREREEYLTWSVANARGHAASPYGHTESAVGFLTDVEEKLEVAKVQRELLDEVEQLVAHLQDSGVDLNTQSGWGGYDRLQDGLLSVSEVCTLDYAIQ
jgi:nuclear pore complex protein Nup155